MGREDIPLARAPSTMKERLLAQQDIASRLGGVRCEKECWF